MQRSRLRADNRKWLLSKTLPRIYGDKVAVEATGRDGAPLIPEGSSNRELARAILDVLRESRLEERTIDIDPDDEIGEALPATPSNSAPGVALDFASGALPYSPSEGPHRLAAAPAVAPTVPAGAPRVRKFNPLSGRLE